MAILTGNSGELRYKGLRIGKCRNFSLDVSRDTLETTGLGEYDRTYVEGLRGATGSATVLYDETDSAVAALVGNIFTNNQGPQSVDMILNSSSGKAFRFQALINQMSTPVSVGEVVACNVSFQVSGAFEETI